MEVPPLRGCILLLMMTRASFSSSNVYKMTAEGPS